MFTRSNEQAFSTLLPGDFVGDYQLIFGYPNDFTVRANPAKFVEALVLDFPGLRKATADFDDQVCDCTCTHLTITPHAARRTPHAAHCSRD